MAQFSLGEWLQKLLFTTTFRDIVESIDGLKTRVEQLDEKLEREVATLRQQLEDTKNIVKRPPTK